MKTYKVKVPVTVSVTWTQELVENKENFYIRMKPHINLGGVKGAASLTRVQTGGSSRYVLTKAQNELMKQIKMDNEFKKEIKSAIIGKQTQKAVVKVKAPAQTLPKIQTQLTAEDFATGSFGRETLREDTRQLSTGFSSRELEKFEKGE